MASNIKGFLDHYFNPETIIPEADKRNLDYRMATACTDGTGPDRLPICLAEEARLKRAIQKDKRILISDIQVL